MLLKLMSSTAKSKAAGRFLRLTGALAFALSLAPAAVPTVQAGDIDGSIAGAADSGHFVRMGLNKSVVIKLPGEAKDVIVGDPAIVDAVVRNKSTAYLFARAVGQTNIFFFDAQGKQILSVDLEVSLDMMALQKLIRRTVPGSQIVVDTVGGNVVLNGTATNAVAAKVAVDLAAKFAGDETKVVNAMKISGGDQVMLKVRVVEIQRDVLKSLGINLDNVAFDIGNFAFNLATSNPVLGSFFGAAVNYNSDSVDVTASINALEQDGILHTLAEPTLTAVSGQAASFLAGGQFPYVSGSTCDTNGRNCTNTITYKDFGVKLGFTPIVLSEGRISLQIITEVSELSDVITGALNTRTASTTLELPSGGSMMLAGLIKDSARAQIHGTPGLKNLPVLGALFRSRDFAANQTELVVIVTPFIVNPVAEKKLASPGHRLNNATDRQAILFGRLNQVYGTAGRHPDGVYHGSVGFIIE
jgi:pilus assembly protein CpaC